MGRLYFLPSIGWHCEGVLLLCCDDTIPYFLALMNFVTQLGGY